MRNGILIAWATLLLGGLTVQIPAAPLQVQDSLDAVRAYPNPWRADRHGAYDVTIDGLPASGVSSVRIFTIAGEQVRRLGGTQGVSWDLRNDRGELVASGVYLYLVTTNHDKKIGKIAVIR